MKLDQLRRIIREEVKTAIKEELQDILTEAVQIASAPTKMQPAPIAGQTSWSAPVRQKETYISDDPIMEMLNQTKASMTSREYQNIMSATSDIVTKPNFDMMVSSEPESFDSMPGLDISQLDFVTKAKAVFDASVKKDKERLEV